MNKRLFWVLVLSAWGSLLSNVANAEEKPLCDPTQSKIGAAKIAAVQGKVEAKRTTDETWHSAKRNAIYCPGDQIRVGKDSRASIVLSNETLVRLDQYSVITLSQIDTEGPSLLELVKGIAHFISRVPRSLKVNTPFVNAAIEGTEFVVAVKENDTTVTVFEGIVLTENENGQVRLMQNESSIAKEGQAPEKILLAKPRDTVQWALYFPPIIKGDEDGSKLQQASSLLYVGRVEEATALLADMGSNGEAKALQSIIAIVNNDKDSAARLASEAVTQAPDSAAAHIAMSYAWQAQLDLEQALSSAEQATNKVPDNAIAWARLAELQLSVGELDDALSSAKKASDLDGSIARSLTILGFAYLTQINTEQARATFNKAIELNQSDPLPHLGLGLAMIRENELAAGRREIEIAASLDPNNAIIRSYLGKAYYEEKRGPLDAEQFAMAKALDPNDPTPYFYDAIRKQTENNPVGALEDLNKSIRLNNNRAVYRSSLQLDQDEAARNAGLARIYQELGFEQLAINEASKSIAQDPNNYSAHELLADSYLSKPRHEIARVSETLQAKLLNPLNSNPQQTQLTQGSLTLLNNLGTNSSSNNEYNNLFQRNSLNLTLSGLGAGNNTSGHEAIFSGTYDWFAFSIGTYKYETDGFHSDNKQDQKLDRYFAQARVTNNFSIFLERLEKDETRGDQLRFDISNFFPSRVVDVEEKSNRVGLLYKIDSNNSIVATYVEQEDNFIDDLTLISESVTQEGKTDIYEFKYTYNGDVYSLVAGHSDSDSVADVEFLSGGIPYDSFTDNIEDSSSFLYNYLKLHSSLDLTIGVSHEKYSSSDLQIDIEETNPKIGISWSPTPESSLRLAYFEVLRRTFIGDATIEPTLIAGFNQFYDDGIGAESKQSAIAIDHKVNNNLILGIEYLYRELEVPSLDFFLTPIQVDMLEKTATAYANIVVNPKLALSIKAQREHLLPGSFPLNDTFEETITYRFPVSINFFVANNAKTNLNFTYIDQKGTYLDAVTFLPTQGEDSFWTTDLTFSMLFPKRTGNFSVGIKNVFDEEFSYEETDPKNPKFARERIGFASVNLFF